MARRARLPTRWTSSPLRSGTFTTMVSPDVSSIRYFTQSRFLGILGDGVILGIRAEDRSALAESGEKRGRHVRRTLLDLEPLLPQQVAVGPRRLVLAERGLRIPPDLEVKVRQALLVGIHPRQCSLLLWRNGAHVPS